ncbi:MAG: hypothetical protein GX575_11455 [Candidatus Anammoximicrobium sp.]|nr:hypothetical protein [Candidatus Anammoximicrobium sp.]
MDKPQLDILLLVHGALTAHLKANKPNWLTNVSCDNDANSGEIIFELSDGRSFVVSTAGIRELD